MKKFLIILIISLSTTSFAFAQNSPAPFTKALENNALLAQATGLVPCENDCGFDDVMKLINTLIEFLITKVFIPVIILLFMFAGYKYITAGGNPAKVANVKSMIKNIVIGMILVLCSWLIVKTVLSTVAREDSGVLQFLE